MTGMPLPWVLPVIVAAAFVTMSLAERAWPLRPRVEPWFRHVLRNLTTGGIALAVMTAVQIPILIPVAQIVEREKIGLLNWIELADPWSTIVVILIFDYTLWMWHRVNHRVPFLWRFHLAHHVDLDVDASTALRFHFGELALSIPVRAAQIAISGAEPAQVMVFQSILFVAILFHHSNIGLPRGLEAILVRLIVTPRMHGIHHSARREHTDSNWSAILPVWDVLHSTFRFDVPDEAIRIGVPAYQSPREVTIGRVLAIPFRTQRDDWAEAR